ncbi:MAG: TerB family tellurite resistance protein, partial [Ottowia sp.]|nr:TerB family tellurite resistance protein [Ottowia sp.]
MIAALRKLFEAPTQESEADRQQRTRLAAAALLIETARADFTQEASEQAALEHLLTSSLQLEPAAVRELLEAASSRLDESTS